MKVERKLAPGVDTKQAIRFTFDGKQLCGLTGDTLASALLANGVWITGRSFKVHRPRGIVAGGAEEPNAIVQLEPGSAHSEPDLKATQVELYEGLNACSVNRWPSVDFDVGAALGVLKRFLPAGFYYKTFMWPSWRTFEPMIRRAAGLGVAPKGVDPDQYDARSVHCDVLIVGAGASGLAAATTLASSGQSILLVDENPVAGGALRWCNAKINGKTGFDWATEEMARLATQSNVTILQRTVATGYYEYNTLTLAERVSEHLPLRERRDLPKQRLWTVKAKHVILATGYHERPMVFSSNDRPGIMLANAAALYSKHFGVRLGRDAIAFVNNDLSYDAVFAAHDTGTSVKAIVDCRKHVSAYLAEGCRARGISQLLDSVVTDTRGRKRVAVAHVKKNTGAGHWMSCDLLLVSSGWSPAVHLFSQAGGKVKFDSAAAMFVPDPVADAARNTVVGAARGQFELGAAMAEGTAAALAYLNENAIDDGHKPHDLPRITHNQKSYNVTALWRVPGNKPAWVDFQNDVTAQDIELAARENFASVEHLKRYTTMGMASDQGKTSNVTALALLGVETNRSPEQVGTTKFRPPYSPITIGTMAGQARGDLLRPRLYLAAHDVHVAHGANMMEYGPWIRPAFYPHSGESDASAWNREVAEVRNGVGVLDGSPLGKIEVKGPDAGSFLNRMYANELGNLAVGRSRYCVMLNEGGGLLDDGVVSRLGENHFLVGTTSSGSHRIHEWLEYWRQGLADKYKVAIYQGTDDWATFAITGPKSRSLVEKLPVDMDVSKDAFPHMAIRTGFLGDVPCRVARVSFTGEMTFELSVPTEYAASVLECVLEAGATPFGAEALMIMRLEKGYIHLGVESDPQVTPAQIGMGAFGNKKTIPYIGQRASRRSAMVDKRRVNLVGVEANDPSVKFRAGSHLVSGKGKASEGHVTSAAWSPTLNKMVALALLENGTQRLNEPIQIYDNGNLTPARIVTTCFLDPDNARLSV